MRIRMYSRLALLGTMVVYPVLYWSWVKQMKNSWVIMWRRSSKTIFSKITQTFFTPKPADTPKHQQRIPQINNMRKFQSLLPRNHQQRSKDSRQIISCNRQQHESKRLISQTIISFVTHVLIVNYCSICLVKFVLEFAMYLLYARSIESMTNIVKAISVVRLSKMISLFELLSSQEMNKTVLMPKIRILTLKMASQTTNQTFEMQRQLLSRMRTAVCRKIMISRSMISKEVHLRVCDRLKLKIIMRAATIHRRKERRLTSKIYFKIIRGIDMSLSKTELVQKRTPTISSIRQLSVFWYWGSSMTPKRILPDTKLSICMRSSLFSCIALSTSLHPIYGLLLFGKICSNQKCKTSEMLLF